MLLRKQRARVRTVFISIKDKSVLFFKNKTRIRKSSDWDVDPQKVTQITFVLCLIWVMLSKSPAWGVDERIIEYYYHQPGRVPIDVRTRKALTPDLVHVNMRCLVRKHLNEALKGGFNQRQIDANEIYLFKLVKACLKLSKPV